MGIDQWGRGGEPFTHMAMEKGPKEGSWDSELSWFFHIWYQRRKNIVICGSNVGVNLDFCTALIQKFQGSRLSPKDRWCISVTCQGSDAED